MLDGITITCGCLRGASRRFAPLACGPRCPGREYIQHLFRIALVTASCIHTHIIGMFLRATALPSIGVYAIGTYFVSAMHQIPPCLT